MNKSKLNLLRDTLIAGTLNVETYEKIKKEIFIECHLNSKTAKDRALWSTWINGRAVPNRFCQAAINEVLSKNQIQQIYD